ncbi:MAG TPA: M1 family aminopeptidase [Candidatus Eisenbacteria bacterium]|nr:M1 family aminopeptidase [Candidatus Eisenbacteria bacterium]
MNPRRLGATFSIEFWHSFRRPLFIILAFLLLLMAFGLSSGKMQIASGDTSVGGLKAWITSEFAQTQTMTYLTLLIFAFFIAIASGLILLKDRESKVDVLLHSTPLTAGEYVWGRFLAVMSGFVGLMVLWAMASAFFNHAVPNGGAQEIRGPFVLGNYLKPVLLIGLPFLLFYGGVSLYVGEKTRNPVLVFVLPIATMLLFGFFLWEWSPSWLDPTINKVLQVVDPAGFRWLNETHLKVDRGVEYYNSSPVPLDGIFWLNRAWLILLGIGGVLLTQRSVAASLKGERVKRGARVGAQSLDVLSTGGIAASGRPEAALASLRMKSGVPSFFRGVAAVASIEVRLLLRQPGLYIFIPLILMQGLTNTLLAVGPFDTPILLTPGNTAAAIANQISLWVCLLLLFYTVESLERERANGLSHILYSTPLRTGAFLLGKAVANSLVAVAVLFASLIGCAIALGIQGKVPFSIGPYIAVWGLLLVPTFLAWTAFISAAYAAVGNRYAAYAAGLAALIWTGYALVDRSLSWATNWPLWAAIRWSDLGFFETDRAALILNRIMVLGLAMFFTVVAVRLFRRRGPDGVRIVHGLSPGQLARTAVRLLPAAAVPLVACIALAFMVSQGMAGGAAKKAHKDYWAKNLKTWLGAPLPDIARADIRLKIDPSKKWLSSQGTLTLVNPLDSTMTGIPVTAGLHWKNLKWTMNGTPATPEDRQHLVVFTPPKPLAKGDSVTIGWSWDGNFPNGVTKRGENTDEFVLPSGVVLTGFSPSFMPVLGFQEDVGETKDNKTEPRQYARDYWKGTTRAAFGATAWFPARIVVTGPEAYTLNSVGVCTSNTVKDGWRTQVWETDAPVKILNVVCGRWDVKQGNGTTIYYHAAHTYNIEEMSATLDAARRYYSEWFLPYPWRELKLSEFPALAGYAQGFGTNITFSENIGFLTKNDAKTDATFLVTAHEAAHQWWGNILTPAKGPGGDFLSESMSHFSTLLLFEQVKGPRGRMEFAKGIESRYGDRRRVNDERPMYDVDGSRGADETVIYDRGGWVFWMLYDYLGHERALEGYQAFIRAWSKSRDHAALQDIVAALRPFAADPVAYDAFVEQWFENRVIPEYRIDEARKTKQGGGYDVVATVRNRGTGTMPVEVAATAGDRWEKPSKGGKPFTQSAAYREARATVVLGPGETKTVRIRCPFDPERIVMDPDVRVLQLQRKAAVATL